MNRRNFLKDIGLIASTFFVSGYLNLRGEMNRKPNFIIIFTDDQGYADVGCYGAKGFKTPNLDRMAAEGIRFTDFYVGCSVCTPSRVALLTGCYPQRVGLPNVLGPNSKIGINSEEETIAEILKTKGYATACYGKWHLGDHKKFLPIHHGFDDYFGLPYSNDMWPYHPEHPEKYPPLPLIEGEKVIEYNPDQTQLTTWYTERAVKFIEKNKDKPFFLYLAHSMPHVPLHVSDKFKGKSKQGLYGDVIMEIDWSVGQGQRVPCIMRWPGKIPAGSICKEIATAMDILPTFARLAGARLPKKKIDGKDIWPLISGQPGAKSPHEAFYYYRGWDLQAVRSGKWKLHLPHKYRHLVKPGKDGKPGIYEQKTIELALFDLENDISEKNNLVSQYPDVVKRLMKLADKIREDIGDGRKNMKGKNRREPGRI